MDGLNDFKRIADEIMSDIKVEDELKNKTWKQCMEKPKINTRKVFLSAAGFVLTIGLLAVTHNMTMQKQLEGLKEPSAGIMMAADATADISAGNVAISGESNDKTCQVWQPESVEEAKRNFGDRFLTPGYHPDQFTMDQIQATGKIINNADMIIISYLSGSNSYLIMEEKNNLNEPDSSFQSMKINGEDAFIHSSVSDGPDGKSVFTELTWLNKEVRYTVTGQISKEDAIKIAKAME